MILGDDLFILFCFVFQSTRNLQLLMFLQSSQFMSFSLRIFKYLVQKRRADFTCSEAILSNSNFIRDQSKTMLNNNIFNNIVEFLRSSICSSHTMSKINQIIKRNIAIQTFLDQLGFNNFPKSIILYIHTSQECGNFCKGLIAFSIKSCDVFFQNR
ncbi:hypothetical protein TTHERM_000637389 (macronuclear) [Tetrahymena thermophila SB210]|uniref:Uncharacterized protein n=1 Tax=Tetrahymena thermophila (strain SB210) TaxID=312017 RepID=W7X6D3_TETTS|nr:hypothetical protein TTHERM_000637389 [Tetrahymena thermophila SB210]EWS72967.1 hypothetical protein TTHERM_000637389 [Tetrahymena thermophila SB210]|eukprot:XP_012654500.1 hypothetical protein TTHERM_000637389 [Tetrahymena thermophila SB210]